MVKLRRKENIENYIQEKREKIEQELEFLNSKSYSSNIINSCLQCVADKCGKIAANDLIDEFGLDKLGWNKVKGR